MNKTYELLLESLVDTIEYHFDIDDYDDVEALENDIRCESEEIITDCLDTISGFFIEDFAEYAYKYLVEIDATKEELLETIKEPERMLRYACYYALDEAISKVINYFCKAKEGV